MLLIFFGGQMLVNQVVEGLGYDTYVEVSPFTAGVATIGFIYGAYMTETFRGAILAVPVGQLEAGQAFGMSAFQVFWRILLPQTIRHALPGFGNNWLVLLKTTALLSVLGLDDLLRKASLAAGATREPFTFYLAAALVYLLLTSVSTVLLGWAERRAEQPYITACPWTLASSRPISASTSRGCGPPSGWWRRPWCWGCCCRCRWRWRARPATR